ncbi:MAG: hypothetical protein ACRDVL_06845, partial [Acidimicrobiia bacterium]
ALMGALADCEQIANSLLGQPANALSTLSFLVAGIVVARRRDLTWVGVALVATGIGSFLFHGPMAPEGQWLHDTTLVWLIAVIAGWNRPWKRWTRVPGLVLLGVVFAGAPLVADPLAIALTATTLGLILIPDRSLHDLGPIVLLGMAAVVGRLGATGGPLCDPDSLLQPHALWHMAAAAAVAWWALGRELPDTSDGLVLS